MPPTHSHLATRPGPAGADEPPYYAITLYTSVTEQDAAADLARRVADIVDPIPEIDNRATTICSEEVPHAEPVKVYADLVKDRSGR